MYLKGGDAHKSAVSLGTQSDIRYKKPSTAGVPFLISNFVVQVFTKALFSIADCVREALAAFRILIPTAMLISVLVMFTSPVARAQTPNTTINFQARILQSTGSLVPDGNYHVEFKIYDDISAGATAQGVCTGNCVWMETRTTGNLVRVVNGYVSANLGSVTAFGSTIPWSQNLYVTMRVGGSAGAASWDTEMTNTGNRMKLNAVPLALVANNVRTANRTSTNSDNITIQTGDTTTSGNSGNISIDAGNGVTADGTITLGATNASALTLGRTGLTTTVPGALTVTQAGTFSSTLAVTGNTTLSGGTLTLNNVTSNLINFGTAGVAAPTFTTRSAGAKIVLYNGLTGSAADYALGIEANTLWNGVPGTGDQFRWYGGTTLAATLSGTGNFTLVGDLAVNGGDITTTSGTFNLAVSGATTVNAFDAATALNIADGATTKTIDIGGVTANGTDTVNISTNATASDVISIGSTNASSTNTLRGGASNLILNNTSATLAGTTINLNGATIVGNAASQDLFNTIATTLNIGGAATTVTLGATSGTLSVRNANTTLGNAAGSGLFLNNGATRNTTLAVANLAGGGAIGTAAATVDIYTAGAVNQTTASQTLSLPSPTSTTAGRIFFVSNVGSVAFTMHSVSLAAGASQLYIWNGTTWAASSVDGSGAGVTTLSAIGSTPNANGATITGSTLNLQPADGSFGGVVTTGTQTFAGAKTFSSAISAPTATNTINGLIINAGAVSGATTINASGTITGVGLAAGAGQITGSAGLVVSGNVSLATTGTNTFTAGNGTGATTINGNSSSNFVFNGVTISATEFNLLDTKDTALVDTTDAVSTAIIGTGALNGGSITSGFGAIDIGADTITSGLINGQTISSSANFTGSLAVGTTGTFTGLLTANGGLTVGNASIFSTLAGTDYSTTGSTNNVAFGNASLYRLTGASAQTITGIAGGSNGRILTLINAGTTTAVLTNNDAASTATNRITTGTGASISIPVGSSISLVYDGTAGLWRTTGDVAGGGGLCATCANTSLSNLTAVAINTALLPGADNTIDLGSNVNSFRTLYADTSVLTSTLDVAAAGSLNIGTSTATGLLLGSTSATTSISLQGTAAANYTIGDTGTTGTITLGRSTASNIINIGSAAGSAATQTINLGTGTSTTSGGKVVNIANGIPGAGTTNIIAIGNGGTTTGTVGITIGSNGGAAHTTLIQGGNGATALQLQTATGAGINIGTLNNSQTINIGNSGGATTLNLTGSSSVSLDGGGATQFNVGVNTTTGTILMGGTTQTGTITVGRSTASNTISIGSGITGAGNTQTIDIANGAGAGTAVNVNILSGIGTAGTGTLSLGNNPRVTQIDLGNSSASAARTINIASGNSAGTDTLNIATGNLSSTFNKVVNIANGNPSSSGVNQVTIGSIAAGGNTTTIQGGNGATALRLMTAAGGTLSVGDNGAASTVQIGNTSGAVTQTINIGTSAAASSTTNVTVGSTIAGTVTLQSASTVNINAGTIVGNAATQNLFNTTATTLNIGGAATTLTLGATSGTLTVRNANTTLGNAAGSGLFLNNGATRNATLAVANLAGGGAIGTAAATVDIYTAGAVNQTTASQTLSLPSPTSTTAGRIFFVSNVGSVAFTMHSVSLAAGASQLYIWNGTTWAASSVDGSGAGVTTLSAIGSTPNANGATITGSTLNLQPADGSFGGVVTTGTQTFAGAKTFSAAGTALVVTNSASIGTSLLIGSGAASVGGTGIVQPYAVSSPGSGPSLQWSNGSLATTLGLYVSSGLNFQGDSGNPSLFVRQVTGTGSLGAITVKLGGANGTDTSYFNAGNVGVGDTSPSALLTVGNGDLFQVNSSGAIAASTGINNSGGYTQTGSTANTFTGATTINNKLSVTGTVANTSYAGLVEISATATSTTNDQVGSNTILTVTPSAVASRAYFANYSQITSASSNFATSYLIGAQGRASYTGTGTIYSLQGLSAQTTIGASGTAQLAAGLTVLSTTTAGGSVGTNYGIFVEPQTAGTTDYGIYVQGADTYALFVDAGATRLDGNLEVDTNSLFVDATANRVGVNTTTTTNGILSVTATTTNSAADDAGVRSNITVASGATANFVTFSALNGTITSSGTNNAQSNITGVYTDAQWTGAVAKTGSAIRGAYLQGGNYSTVSVSDVRGAQVQAVNNTTGSVNALYGIELNVNNNSTGAITTQKGIDLNRSTGSSGAATISTTKGLEISNLTGSGTVTTNYGLQIQDQAYTATTRVNLLLGASATSGAWSIYNSSTSNNVFAGNLRVGSTTAPTVALDVTGAGAISGNLAVDTDTLFADATNNRVGIGSTGGSGKLTVTGATSALLLLDSTGANNAYITVRAPASQQAGIEFVTNGTTRYQIGAQTDNSFFLYDNANTRNALTITTGTLNLQPGAGNVIVGQTDGVGSLFVVDVKNTATDPTGQAGAIYYNSNAGAFRCFTTAWGDCQGSGASKWTDNGAWTHLAATADRLVIGQTADVSTTKLAVISTNSGVSTSTFNPQATLTLATAGRAYNTWMNTVIAPTGAVAANTNYSAQHFWTNVLGGGNLDATTDVRVQDLYTEFGNGTADTIGSAELIFTSTVVNSNFVVSNFNGIQLNNPGGSGLISANAALTIANQTKGGNPTSGTTNTNLLIGTTTIPAGNWSIYNESTYQNYLAGSVNIGGTTPNLGQLSVVGDSDETQLSVRAHSTQSAFNLVIFEGSDSANFFELKADGRMWYKMATGTTSTEQFKIGDGASSTIQLLEVDSVNDRVQIGDVTADAAGTVLVLDNKNDNATDPTGIAGATYYNSFSGAFRCYTTLWINCGGIGGNGVTTFQTQTNSTTGFRVLESAGDAILTVDTTNDTVSIDGATQYTQRLCHDNADGAAQEEMILGDCNAAGQADLAEMYDTNGTLEPGDIVYPTGAYSVDKTTTAYQASAIGIVSTNPIADGIIGNNVTSPNRQPIALAGRVPLKISLENGPIAVGDYLTPSSTPGFAMKATAGGRTIGVALEAYDGTGPRVSALVATEEADRNVVHVGVLSTYVSNPALWPTNTGKIMVFVNAGYYTPSTANLLQGASLQITGNANIAGDTVLGGALNVSGAVSLANNLTVTGITQLSDLIVTNSILPGTAGTVDLGSPTAEFDELFIADDSGLVFGSDQDATLAYDETGEDRVELSGANADLFLEDRLMFGVQMYTVTDDGITDILTPVASYVRIDIDELANAGIPDLQLSEFGARDGQVLIILNNELDASGDTFTMNDTAGVQNSTGTAIGPEDAVMFMYMNDRWVAIGGSNN